MTGSLCSTCLSGSGAQGNRCRLGLGHLRYNTCSHYKRRPYNLSFNSHPQTPRFKAPTIQAAATQEAPRLASLCSTCSHGTGKNHRCNLGRRDLRLRTCNAYQPLLEVLASR